MACAKHEKILKWYKSININDNENKILPKQIKNFELYLQKLI
jgi:hypothetical protein